jgi:hypothetical protein
VTPRGSLVIVGALLVVSCSLTSPVPDCDDQGDRIYILPIAKETTDYHAAVNDDGSIEIGLENFASCSAYCMRFAPPGSGDLRECGVERNTAGGDPQARVSCSYAVVKCTRGTFFDTGLGSGGCG